MATYGVGRDGTLLWHQLWTLVQEARKAPDQSTKANGGPAPQGLRKETLIKFGSSTKQVPVRLAALAQGRFSTPQKRP